MNLRHHSIPLLLTLIPTAASAQIIAGGGEISVGADLVATYDSNLSARAGAEGGYFATLSPGATYKRSNSLISSTADLRIGVERHPNHAEYNQETYHASGGFLLDKGTLGNYSLSLNAAFSDGSSANYDLGARLKQRSYGLNGEASFDTSERSGFSLNTSLIRYDSSGYGKQDTFQNGVEYHFGPFMEGTNFYVNVSNTLTKSDGRNVASIALDQSATTCTVGLGKQLTEKVLARVNAGYNWHNTSTKESLAGWGDSSGAVVSASLTGPFLPEKWFPKTTSSLSIAYSDSASRGIYDTGGKQFSGSASVGWKARENTTLDLSASRSRRLTIDDRTTETSTISIGVSEKLTTGLALRANLGYNWNTYQGLDGSKQKGLVAAASASYGFGSKQQWSSSLNFNYNANSSNVSFRDFNHYTVSASLSYKY